MSFTITIDPKSKTYGLSFYGFGAYPFYICSLGLCLFLLKPIMKLYGTFSCFNSLLGIGSPYFYIRRVTNKTNLACFLKRINQLFLISNHNITIYFCISHLSFNGSMSFFGTSNKNIIFHST